MKIKDLLRIIKEAQQREKHLEYLQDRTLVCTEDNRIVYDPNGCKKEYDEAKRAYDEWANSDLSILFGESTEYPNKKCEVDDATHATNMYIIERLKGYLDKNPTIRFGQALMNLDIVRVATKPRIDKWNLTEPDVETFVLDPYYDKSDDILERIKGRLEYEENKRIF